MTERIVLMVLDRGFVVVGRASIYDGLAFHWQLTPGRTVRQWGTTQGLSQLRTGPTPQTILDPAVDRLVPFRSIIEILMVEEEKWEQHLPRLSETGTGSPRKVKATR